MTGRPRGTTKYLKHTNTNKWNKALILDFKYCYRLREKITYVAANTVCFAITKVDFVNRYKNNKLYRPWCSCINIGEGCCGSTNKTNQVSMPRKCT